MTMFESFKNIPGLQLMTNIILGFVGFIFALVLILSMVFTVPSGYVGVKYTFGKISQIELQPGIHFLIPFIDSVKVFDTKSQTVNYNGSSDKPDEDGIINFPAIGILDEKNLPISLDVTVQFIAKPEYADEIVSSIGWNYYEKRLNSIVRDVIRDVAGQYQAETIAANRAEINTRMKEDLIRAMNDLPFTISELSLRDIGLPPVIMDKVKAVQEAKQEEQRLGMVLKQAEQSQKIQTTQAETKFIEVSTAARAESERLKLISEGTAKAILIEAEAQARANQMLAESVTSSLVQYNAVKTWNGTPPQTLVSSGNQSIPNMILGIK